MRELNERVVVRGRKLSKREMMFIVKGQTLAERHAHTHDSPPMLIATG